jgi:bisphosphoglycerate-dependent phosphoglycerate mutase
MEPEHLSTEEESPEAWAHRATGKLFGLLKDEIAAAGGAEAFLRWVRSDDVDHPGDLGPRDE